MVPRSPARSSFRVRTRTRRGYDGAVLHDVHLEGLHDGRVAWTRTFTHADEAAQLAAALHEDLQRLDPRTFARLHGALPPA